MVIIQSSCTSLKRESAKMNTSDSPVTSHTNMSKWKLPGFLYWFYIPVFSNGLQCYENFWVLSITSCCNFAIFNAQIPSLLACESSLWIQCTLLYKLAGYLFCPFCCLSQCCNTDTCYSFVSLINLRICRKSLSHWFLESVRISGRESHWPWH